MLEIKGLSESDVGLNSHSKLYHFTVYKIKCFC